MCTVRRSIANSGASMIEADAIMTAREVADHFKVPVARVYELARRGVLPVVHLGARQIRFDRERIRRFADQGGAASTLDATVHNITN